MEKSINNIKLAYDDCGQGPAVVLIHGFPLNRQMWRPQLRPLADAGFRVIAPDLRGFGESDAPGGEYSMSVFADDVIALLDSLEVKRAVVCGMSMGGYVLLNLLERHPDRMAGAGFIVTRPTAEDEAGKARRTELAAEAERLGANPIIKIFAELLFADETSQKNPSLIATVTSWMRATRPQGLAGALIAMRDRKDYVDMLRSFTLPTLVVGGAEDRAGSPEAIKQFSEALPNCTTRIIAGAGHMANMEHPEAFNAALFEFLEKVRGRF